MSRRPGEKDVRATIVRAWRDLGEPEVGAHELGKIQKLLDQAFPVNPSRSPAAIARILADEGAALRHPEIIEFDARWRESQIENEARRLNSLSGLTGEETLSLKQAESLIMRLEKTRQTITQTGKLQS